MADEKDKNSLGDIDDWLADLDDDGQQESAPLAGAAPAAGGDGELDQSDIDQLLGGIGSDAGGTGGAGGDDSGGELDQSDIDSLFNEGSAAPAAPEAAASADDDFADLDQSELDELLAGVSQPEGPAAGEKPEPEAPSAPPQELKDDFDDLFGDDPEPVAAAPAPEAPLKASEGAAIAASPEPIQAEGKDEFGFDSADFDVDGFDFDDSIPDIPDESVLSAAAGQSKAPAAPRPSLDDDIFADTPRGKESGGEGDQLDEELEEGRRPLAAFLPASVNKSTVGAALFSVLVLVGGLYYLLGRQPAEEPAIPFEVREEMVRTLEPELPESMQPAGPPTARDDQYRMEEPGRAIAMQLAGSSADGGPLAYEIVTPPRYGRLSGEPPRVTYLPNHDFPGEDSFAYRVSDGLLASEPARVRIVGRGPQLAAAVAPEPVEEVLHLTPEPPLVRARDLTLYTSSTEALLIDWAEIWRRENSDPFSSRVQVEILEQRLSGRLTAAGPAAHRYQPNPYFAGVESLSYRFNHGGVQSKPRRLTLEVAMGNPPPTVRLRPLAEVYPVGETVLVDARDTLAFRPRELRFEWEQLSGTAVLLESLADNNAMVRFVAPSSFSTAGTPKVVLQVTAVDPAGQRDSRIVEIITPSRRQNALWSRQGGGGGSSPLRGF